jgi:hypothetical protein
MKIHFVNLPEPDHIYVIISPPQEGSSMLRINDEAPNFTAESSHGTINFHEWIGNRWAILFSHPKDFTRCAPRNWVTWPGWSPNSRSAIAR